MIARYTRPEMGRIGSEENKFRQWLEVELAAAEALAETGEVPADAARIDQIEREVTASRRIRRVLRGNTIRASPIVM